MAFKMKGMNHGEGTGSAYPKNSEVKYKALKGGIQPGEYFGQFPKLIGSKIKNLFSKSSPKKNVGYTKEGPKSAAFQKTIAKRDFEAEILNKDKKKNTKKKKTLSKQEKFNKEVNFLRQYQFKKDKITPNILKRAKKIGLEIWSDDYKEER